MSGYKHCITETAADRQRQFEQALLELMGKRDFDQISIQEICGRVELSRKSFYRYFSSKEACLDALVDHTILGFTDFSYDEGKRIQLLERFFAYWQGQKPLLDAMMRNGFSNLFFERAMKCAVPEYGLRSGVLEEYSGTEATVSQVFHLETEENYSLTVFLVSGVFAAMLDWYAKGFRQTPAQLAAILSRGMARYM